MPTFVGQATNKGETLLLVRRPTKANMEQLSSLKSNDELTGREACERTVVLPVPFHTTH